jgi:DNA invertase Pin-like site-specific DNA recombinase
MRRNHTNPRPLRIATYIRISTEPTDDLSAQAQADRVRAYAESLGWQPLAAFEPDPAPAPVAP